MNNHELVEATIINVNKTYLEVKTQDQLQGIVHISQISDYYVSNLSTIFRQGQRHWFSIIKEDQTHRQLKLCWKNLHPRFLKNPFEFQIHTTTNGFHNLKQNTWKEVCDD